MGLGGRLMSRRAESPFRGLVGPERTLSVQSPEGATHRPGITIQLTSFSFASGSINQPPLQGLGKNSTWQSRGFTPGCYDSPRWGSESVDARKALERSKCVFEFDESPIAKDGQLRRNSIGVVLGLRPMAPNKAGLPAPCFREKDPGFAPVEAR